MVEKQQMSVGESNTVLQETEMVYRAWHWVFGDETMTAQHTILSELIYMSEFAGVWLACFMCEWQYSRRQTGYQLVVPEKVDQDGNFISYEIPHYYHYSDFSGNKKRQAHPMDAVNYKINIEGNDYLLELWPNTRFISPGMVIETRHDYELESGSNMDIKRLQDMLCHYKGYLRDLENSIAVLSACNGLVGYINMNDESYFIEPVRNFTSAPDEKHLHILYNDDSMDLKDSGFCGTRGSAEEAFKRRLKRERGREDSVVSKSFKEISKPLFLETLLVLDKTMLNYHRNFDVDNYALTVFSMAHTLFSDASLGVQMELVLVRMIKLEAEDDEMNLAVKNRAEKTLDSFCEWQNKVNPINDKHPNHHDLAVLLTRVNICLKQMGCDVLGLSKIGETCVPENQCNICQDKGLKLGYAMAHEIGHRLGFGKCLEDEPGEHEFNIVDLLPGVVYGADYQCHYIVAPMARECTSGLTCDSLNCEKPNSESCHHTNIVPAPGTKCGENKWCYQMKCISVGERPGAVDGGWGEWQPWSECSRTCGTGVSSMERICNNPRPQHGGRYCIGERVHYKICNHVPCDKKIPTFRDLQCANYNDWVYPEDEKKHTWKAYHMHGENPCGLFCINEEMRVLEMRPRVVDGSSCYRGIRDICIAGVCREIPCDLDLNSQAIEDACGVCHGNGTSCDYKEGTVDLKEDSKNTQVIVQLPKFSRNIRVQEMKPSDAKIIVMDITKKVTYSKGEVFGEFPVPGSKAWLGMIKLKQETVTIPGPITAGLFIMAHALEEVSFMYSYGEKPEKQRKGEYHWEHVEWSQCSAICGRGVQAVPLELAKLPDYMAKFLKLEPSIYEWKSSPYCMESISGRVDDKYCENMKMPSTKNKQCVQAPCPTRWVMNDWSKCKCSDGKGERVRLVQCMQADGEGEGEGIVVSYNRCALPKPRTREPCQCSASRGGRFVREDENCTETSSKQEGDGGTMEIPRGQIITDFEDVDNMHIDVVSSKTGKNQTLRGEEALLFLQNLQGDSLANSHHPNASHYLL
ncbi:A disintegrin and metalloproteinase with thrombospondin motifs 7-like [Hetaerina americana]|uniref:A disintegrin and metalloproteinase with thrombospondin motifs 7-like n=1 Tax=Hetaerina americana TaxID=62018 RepID=UPI003A7F5912